jgi:hypothetical protein
MLYLIIIFNLLNLNAQFPIPLQKYFVQLVNTIFHQNFYIVHIQIEFFLINYFYQPSKIQLKLFSILSKDFCFCSIGLQKL